MMKIKTTNAANVQTIMNSIFTKFAGLAGAYLSDQLRSPVNAQVSSVKTMAYKQYSRSINAPAALGIINMEPLQCNAVLETELSTTFHIIDRLCGGRGYIDPHELTEIETSLLEGIIVRLLQKMREAWSHITDIKPSLRHIETNPLLAQIARPKDKMIIISMEIAIDGVKGKMNFCIPYFSVESLSDRLSGKYIDTTNLDLFANLTDEIQDLKNNFLQLKKDISTDISRLFKENKILDVCDNFEPDYASGFKTEKVENIVKVVRYYIMQDDHLKAAVFLAAVGSKLSIEIFKQLREDEIEVLTFDIARLDLIGTKQKSAVLKEFWDLYQNNMYGCYGGIDFARVILEESVGTEKTIDIINRLTSALQVRPFDFVRLVEPEHLFNIIKQENRQIIALILSYLEPEKAAVILQKYPVQYQIDIIKRIENLKETSPEVLREIERILEKNLASLSVVDYCISGGKKNSHEILECYDPASKKQLENYLIYGVHG